MYAVPCPAYISWTCRGASACIGAFFFFGPRVDFGTPVDVEACADVCVCVCICGVDLTVGSCLLELNVDINSILPGDSPRRLLKCSAAAGLESVFA